MTDIRSFSGTPAEFATFLNKAWRSTFGGGATHQLWDEQLLEWSFYSGSDSSQFRLAAYDGQALVGVFCAQAGEFSVFGSQVRGLVVCCLAVEPSYARKGVGRALVAEMHSRANVHGFRFFLGHTVAGAGTAKPSFLKPFKAFTVAKKRMYVWAQILDGAAVARCENSAWTRGFARTVGALTPVRTPNSSEEQIRAFRLADLDRCYELLTDSLTTADLTNLWTPESLLHQLSGNGFPVTMVLEQNGAVDGFINFHIITVAGRAEMRVAIIDHVIAKGGANAVHRQLLRHASARMLDQNLSVATASRLAGVASSTLLRSGFVPVIPPLETMFIVWDDDLSFDGIQEVRTVII